MLVLEPTTGTDFDQWLDEKNTQDPAVILRIMEQLCDLVATLHSTGIIHHDLRPRNFLIDPDHSIRLIDMGLASQQDIPDTILSSGLGPQGDFRYMAPEQMQGVRGDSRSDIYTTDDTDDMGSDDMGSSLILTYSCNGATLCHHESTITH